MKKLFLVFAIGALAISSSMAQVGFKAGVTFATLSQEGDGLTRDDIENHSIAGPVLGFTFNLNVADIISIQPELLYSQSGGSNSYTLLGATTKTTYRINYLELPVLAKLQLGNNNQQGIGIHLAAGPWVGYALNGKYKSSTTLNESVISETNENFTFDDKDNAERINYGMIGAVGVSIGKLVADLRYNYGFNNLLDKDANNNNDNKPVLQTRGIALTLGYTF